ncbi:MAG: hypothetical protein ACRCX2_16115 [Paraclostridium sp.]
MPADHIYNGTNSLLWRNVKKHFYSELKRYWGALRNQGIVTPENVMKYYRGETMDRVSPFLYSLDARLKYISTSSTTDAKATYYYLINGRRIEYTEKWMRQRILFLDSLYEYGGGASDLSGDCRKYIQARYLRNTNNLKEFTVQVKAKSPMFLHHVGDDMTLYENKRYYVAADKYYSMKIPIESAGDGAMVAFTFGPHIRDIKFPESDIRLSYYNLEWGSSITKLEIKNNNALREIVLEQCDSLQHFDLSGCTNLGIDAGKENLKFDNCPNIRYIDFNKTSVGGFTLNTGGGIVEYLNCNDSKITNFVLTKQHYINSLSIQNCRELSKFEIDECNGVTTVNLPSSLVKIFRVTKCPNVSSITLNSNPYLNSLEDVTDTQIPRRANFVIDACPKLKILNLNDLNNKDMTWLDLINCETVEELNIASCGYLDYIRFSSATRLKKLLANSSGLRRFKIDRAGADVNYLDLGVFPTLESLNVSYCTKLEEIRNIRLGSSSNPASGGSAFRNCSKLKTISGSMYLNSLAGTFAYCPELVSLPSTIDFTTATSASEAFRGSVKFPLTEIKRVLNVSPNITTLYYAFNGNTAITSSDSSPFPSDIFNRQTKLTSFRSVFGGCRNLKGTFPIDIFKNLNSIVNFEFPFEGCAFELPVLGIDTMLWNCTKLSYMNHPFSGIKILRMPDSRFFEKCTELTQLESLFSGQTTMSKALDSGSDFIHPNYFNKNTKLHTVRYTFNGCTNLIGTIPTGLFANNKLLKNVDGIFYNMKGISGRIPENLFPVYVNSQGGKDSRLQYANRLFYACSELDGNIPESLFTDHNNILEMYEMFRGCSRLGSNLASNETAKFPNRFLRGKSVIRDINGMFWGCVELPIRFSPINPDDIAMFDDTYDSLINISNLFRDCTKMDGSLPNELFCRKNEHGDFISSKINSASAVFYNCGNLGGSIPPDLFKSWTAVKDLSYFFYYDHMLEGGFPYDLFYNCTSLTKLNNFLGFNWDWSRKWGTNRDNVVEKYIDEDTGIAMIWHKDLFLYNPNLEDLSLFCGHPKTGFAGDIPQESFNGNPKLKFVSGLFAHSGAKGDLSDNLFGRNPMITKMDNFLWGASGPFVLSPNLIRSGYHNRPVNDTNGTLIVKTFAGMFAGQSTMTGTAPTLWTQYNDALYDNNQSSSNGGKCFRDCRQLSNYANIPFAWGGA